MFPPSPILCHHKIKHMIINFKQFKNVNMTSITYSCTHNFVMTSFLANGTCHLYSFSGNFSPFFGLILALSSLLARSALHFSLFWRLYLWICSFRPHSHIGYWLDEMIVSLEKCFLHIPVLYMLIRILIQVIISTNSMRARNTSQHPQPTVTMLLLQVNNK